MEIPPVNLSISRVAAFHHMPWWVKFGKWQARGFFFTEMGGCLETMAILDIDDVIIELTTMIP